VTKILVTPRSITAAGGHPALGALSEAGYRLVFSTAGKQPDEDELIELLPGCTGYLAGVEQISAKALQAAKQLKVISRNGTGTDAVDLQAAERLGIRVCRAEGANARGVAELTIALIFALARHIPAHSRAIKAGRWERHKGVELRGKLLGLVGCGKIGQLVAEAALALGMEVAAYDLYPAESFAPSGRFRFAPLDEVFERSDIVSLHCPPPADGKAIVGADALAKMRDGVLLVNTARAGLVDADALHAALESGRVAGAALDVFDTEPPAEHPLLAHERVIATPHLGAFTRESVDRAVQVAVDNLLEQLGRSKE